MYRTLIESATYTSQVEAFAGSDYRWDEIAHGLTWSISRGAEEFPIVDKDRGICMAMIPHAFVLFTIKDENSVVLLWVEEILSDEERADS